jgi:hypothetical protein
MRGDVVRRFGFHAMVVVRARVSRVFNTFGHRSLVEGASLAILKRRPG